MHDRTRRRPASIAIILAADLRTKDASGSLSRNSSNPILIADAADLSIREIYLDHVFR